MLWFHDRPHGSGSIFNSSITAATSVLLLWAPPFFTSAIDTNIFLFQVLPKMFHHVYLTEILLQKLEQVLTHSSMVSFIQLFPTENF
jgi:hypothetical protein